MTEPDAGPGLDLGMFAQFNLTLGGLQTELKRLNNRNDDAAYQLATLPRQVPQIQQSINATAVDTLDFGGPQPGRQWEIRLLGVMASQPGTGFVLMATTFTTWYVGQRMPGNAAGLQPMANARWQFPSIPNFKDLSGDIIKVLPQEHLIAALTAIPAAPTQIMCIAVINDLPLYRGRAVVGT